MYMVLYYDTRVRSTVLARWAKDRIPILESKEKETIPESDVESHESSVFKDTRIPISFKKAIAAELYKDETEEIKAEVRSKREAGPVYKNVYDVTQESERMELIDEYQKYVHSPAATLPST